MKQLNINMIFKNIKRSDNFGENIYAGEISRHEAEMDQTNLLENILKFI